MTEYDFSEEGYRRHLESQSRVSQWAHQTSKHAPANPFVPSEIDPELRSDFYANGSDTTSDLSISSSSVTAKPTLKRSHTAPHRDTSRRHDDSRHNHRHSPVDSNKNSKIHSRSSATNTTTDTTTTTQTARPTRHRPSRSHTTDLSSHSAREIHDVTPGRAQPTRTKSTPLHYEHDLRHDGRYIHVPPSKGGYTYVVIPSNGAHIKVVSPSSRSRMEYSTQPPSPRQSPSQPHSPLLKRIFGSIMGSSHSDAKSAKTERSRRTGVETGGKPRRRRGSF